MHFLFLLMFPNLVGLALSSPCDRIEILKMGLAIHGGNLANLKTTRTPEGGPYKKRELRKCSEGACEIGSEPTSKWIYLPSHPDANSKGLVAYPDIEGKRELVSFQAAFMELVERARRGECGSKLIRTHLLEYGSGKVRSDFFVVSSDGSYIWNRTLMDDTYQNTLLNEHL